MIIKNAKVFEENGVFVKRDIYIEEDCFTSNTAAGGEVVDAEGLYAVPGLTDVHFHGCVGYDFCDGTHGRARVFRGGFLVDGDSRGKAAYLVHIRFFHLA